MKMKMKWRGIRFLSIFLFCINYVNSQNLIPNGDFEEYNICPNNSSQFDGYIKYWYNPTISPATPNYYNSCSINNFSSVPSNDYGYNYTKSGNGYSCIVVYDKFSNGHEYISVKLKNQLDSNVIYCVGFYLNLANGNNSIYPNKGSTYAINNFGIYFSHDSTYYATSDTLPFMPQVEFNNPIFYKDTVNWMLAYSTFNASGGEKYLTIGNFHSNQLTNNIQVSYSLLESAAYYIDDAFVYKCSDVATAEAGENIHVCRGDSVQIGMQNLAGYKYKWLPAAGLSNDTLGNPYASPQQTTKYYLYLNKYIETVDSITVYVDNCPETTFNVCPSFANDLIYLDYHNIEINNTHFILYDVCGRRVKDVEITEATAKQSVDISGLSEGMYLYSLVINNGVNYPGKIMVVR